MLKIDQSMIIVPLKHLKWIFYGWFKTSSWTTAFNSLSVNYFSYFHIGIHVFIYYFTAAEQAEIQKTIDELKTEVDKRDANIKQLQTSLKEAETILVYMTFMHSQWLLGYLKIFV